MPVPCDSTSNVLHMLLRVTGARRYHKPVTIFVIVLPKLWRKKRHRHMNYNAAGKSTDQS